MLRRAINGLPEGDRNLEGSGIGTLGTSTPDDGQAVSGGSGQSHQRSTDRAAGEPEANQFSLSGTSRQSGTPGLRRASRRRARGRKTTRCTLNPRAHRHTPETDSLRSKPLHR